MIELNLLPEELRKRRRKLELSKLPLIPIALVLICGIAVIQLVLGGFVFLNRKQKARLDKEWELLAPKKLALDRLKRQISLESEKVQAIEYLMENRLSWSRVLNEISNSLTPDVWLTELSYTEEMRKIAPDTPKDSAKKRGKTKRAPEVAEYTVGRLIISGSAPSRAEESIEGFTEALKQNENFSGCFEKIEPGGQKKSIFANQEVMNFTVICERAGRKPEE